MEVTVVIPTFNRFTRIQETLSALKGQVFRDFNVIVVNDGSVQAEYEQLGAWCKQLPYPCRIVNQRNQGASAATNNGVQLATNGLVILFDDDILPSADCIAQHVAFHKEHPNSILSGSADTDPSRTKTDVQRYKIYMEQQWRKLRPDTEQLVQVSFDSFIITTANMSMPRNIFLEVGGFKNDLRDGYDVDFGFRALLKNIPLYFDRRVSSIHNDQITLRYYAGRQKAYTESKRRIFTEHPDLAGKIKDDTKVQVGGFKKVLYSLLRKKFMVNFAESSSFRWFLPRRLRYRVYGATIASLSYSG